MRVESLRKGIVDYDGIWKKTLALTAADRARRFQRSSERSKSSGRGRCLFVYLTVSEARAGATVVVRERL